ncbi:MAG: endolytic transglycosylase MltG [Microbacteriaceae bacterium]|nr:endolytic transglycosylase MltG [Microbacteriaceae bacterium]
MLSGGAAAVYFSFEQPIRSLLGWQEPTDFIGSGSGRVIINIENGQVGGDVAHTLQAAGVTKTYGAFYSLLLKNPNVIFSPGSYALNKGMSAAAALRALEDPTSKVSTQLVFPEGITVAGVIKKLAAFSDSTKVTGEQLTAAAADFRSFGLPATAPSLEGYLFPATYTFDPGTTAHAMLQRMVDEMFARLDSLGVVPADRHRVLTLAALTQKEGGNTADFYKVARVWQNRLDAGMKLQSDATVRYGAGGSKIATTDAERANPANKYNTYANAGLPIGPISNPGEDAILATMKPAPGNWLFFVLINGSTGETTFSATGAEHDTAVKVWQQWLRDHPGFDK